MSFLGHCLHWGFRCGYRMCFHFRCYYRSYFHSHCCFRRRCRPYFHSRRCFRRRCRLRDCFGCLSQFLPSRSEISVQLSLAVIDLPFPMLLKEFEFVGSEGHPLPPSPAGAAAAVAARNRETIMDLTCILKNTLYVWLRDNGRRQFVWIWLGNRWIMVRNKRQWIDNLRKKSKI